ncbi:MAG: hypothetical protein KAT54_01490, partial [Candidatus Marinimicrobia bacterium]|nr:hypothetical protein [Candidatus Neomarinimicrobiota bacterium]
RSSLRMTHTRLLPLKESGQVTTFYEIVKYQIVGIILVIFMLLSNSACWFYSFKGTLPPHIKSVAIPVLTDRTAEFNIQQVVTDQIRIGFIQENILKLAEEDNAHSVLYGTIQSIQDRPLVFKESESGEAVTEYRLTLKVEVEWFDKVEKKAIFKKQFTGYSEYDPTGATDRTRELALEESVDQIIEDIINSILAGW